MRAARRLALALVAAAGWTSPAAASDADEVPAFLRRPLRPVPGESGLDARDEDDPLPELMKQVQVGGSDEEGSFVSIEVPDHQAPPADAPSPPPARGGAAAPDSPAPEAAAPAQPARSEADPCEDLRAALREREAYLRRVAAEREAFAWVEDPKDAQALRLLQSMRRCAEHPTDEDCQPPPIERRLEELEPPRHTFERWPTELNADGKAPDEIPHDPVTLDLLHRLRRCEERRDPQPLLRSRPLDRGPHGR